MMSSGPQPSTSVSSGGYNNMLRGIGRESGTIQSAKNGGLSSSQQANSHPYQMLPNSNNLSMGGEGVANNSLSINGINEKLLYKGGASGSNQVRGDHSSNGYLIKSAQSQV